MTTGDAHEAAAVVTEPGGLVVQGPGDVEIIDARPAVNQRVAAGSLAMDGTAGGPFRIDTDHRIGALLEAVAEHPAKPLDDGGMSNHLSKRLAMRLGQLVEPADSRAVDAATDSRGRFLRPLPVIFAKDRLGHFLKQRVGGRPEGPAEPRSRNRSPRSLR